MDGLREQTCFFLLHNVKLFCIVNSNKPGKTTMQRKSLLIKFGILFLYSLVFFIILSAILHFVKSPAIPLIGIVFVSYFAWRDGVATGLVLTVLNHLWVDVAFNIFAPEYTRAFPPEAIISLVVHIGVSFLLGNFGKLAKNLRKEVEVRKKAENSLKQLQNELEERVEARTRELEKVNEQLLQARKMEAIGNLAGSVAHDFNNHLNIILGYSALLTKRLPENSQDHEFARNIEKTAETAAELTSQLLTFARKKKYKMQTVNLNDLIRELLPLLASALKRGIDINYIEDPQIPLFQGGADLIKNALLNLCLNARDAMKNEGTLTLTTRTVQITAEYCRARGINCTDGVYASVEVTDTGSGIEPEVLNHLFEPFFTTKEEGKGTGMGLAAVYGTMQSHHGAVFAQTAVGEGTTFTLLFPAQTVPATDTPTEDAVKDD
jgi:signal transduction histidine kinase